MRPHYFQLGLFLRPDGSSPVPSYGNNVGNIRPVRYEKTDAQISAESYGSYVPLVSILKTIFFRTSTESSIFFRAYKINYRDLT